MPKRVTVLTALAALVLGLTLTAAVPVSADGTESVVAGAYKLVK